MLKFNYKRIENTVTFSGNTIATCKDSLTAERICNALNFVQYRAEKQRLDTVNKALAKLTEAIYMPNIPIEEAKEILEQNGFNTSQIEGKGRNDEGAYRGPIAENASFVMTWYKMPVSGNYEIVTYVG